MCSMLTGPRTCEVSSRAKFFVSVSFVKKSLLVNFDSVVLVA